MAEKADHTFKAGDEVFIDGNRYGIQRPMRLATVEKVTKTQFTAGGIRFKPYGIDTGFEVGGSKFNPLTARRVTEELRQRQAFLTAQQEAESGLFRVSEALRRAKGQAAIDAWAALPQSIRDVGEQS